MKGDRRMPMHYLPLGVPATPETDALRSILEKRDVPPPVMGTCTRYLPQCFPQLASSPLPYPSVGTLDPSALRAPYRFE